MVNGQRLLLVEDDAATREVLALLLGAEGWAVTAVDCGEAALAAIEGDARPAVVLCDLHLPGMEGTELLQRLRHMLAADAMVLAMTASMREGAGTGYDAVLVKPFRTEAVEAAWALGQQESFQAAVEEPVLDLATVDRLRTGMGEAGMRGLYAFALGDAGDRMDRMDAAVVTGDEAVFVREAHALKGSCGMIGARKVWRLAGDAEMEGFAPDRHEKVTRLRVAIEAVRLMLEALFPM